MTWGATKAPAESVFPLKTVTPVFLLRMTTWAFETRAPVESNTCPRMVALVFCAYARPAPGKTEGRTHHPARTKKNIAAGFRRIARISNGTLLIVGTKFMGGPPKKT